MQPMTGKDLTVARRRLGRRWGFGRDLHYSELARALRLGGGNPSQTVRNMERRDNISGPIQVAVLMMLEGADPPDGIDVIKKATRWDQPPDEETPP